MDDKQGIKVDVKKQGLQNLYLNNLKKKGEKIKIYTVNGIFMTGTIVGFDDYCVIIAKEGIKENTQDLVYKHAISTIEPYNTGEVVRDKVR